MLAPLIVSTLCVATRPKALLMAEDDLPSVCKVFDTASDLFS
jgi:hypothetical protein